MAESGFKLRLKNKQIKSCHPLLHRGMHKSRASKVDVNDLISAMPGILCVRAMASGRFLFHNWFQFHLSYELTFVGGSIPDSLIIHTADLEDA